MDNKQSSQSSSNSSSLQSSSLSKSQPINPQRHECIRLLVSGYRNYKSKHIIEEEMKKIIHQFENPAEITIIHGGCHGVDSIAEEIAKENYWNTCVFKADWNNYGLGAGPKRNEQMITRGHPTHALLFVSKFSKGTLDMKKRLDSHKIPYTCIKVD